MFLHTLLRQLDPSISLSGLPNSLVTGVQEDSRRIEPGHLFVARPGVTTDGQAFVQDAKARGAIAVVTQSPVPRCPLPQIPVPNAAVAASILANLFFERPGLSLNVVGVTGTNGKTTTTYLLRHLLMKVQVRCGLIGTVEIDYGRARRQASMTTPSAIEVAELLATMRDRGCLACAMEVSSHALDQARVAGVHFSGAAFTNLTGDHLDYHKDMDSYAAAKARLFESLEMDAVAVVNAEDTWSARMVRDSQARVIRFGFGKRADYRASGIEINAQGAQFMLTTPGGKAPVQMGLIGRHNIENALTAAAVAGEVFDMTANQIAAGLEDAQGAPGRLQAVRIGQPFAVLVDYAHTDDALQNVLSALRPLTRGKLRVLFGCGGDRDRTKRPRMARTAQTLADVVYVTSDNPRTEDPQEILNEILAGFSAARGAPVVEIDRKTAIRRVIDDAGPDDVVLIAGKGHENYQIIGATKHHFDDVEEATAAIRSRFDPPSVGQRMAS